MGEPKDELTHLEWLQLKGEIGSVEFVRESAWQKFMRKSKENPFVPIGALVTFGCLVKGLDSFRRGESRQSQLMMRGRVLAQGFTVAALAIGILYSGWQRNEARKQLQDAQAESAT